jgi:hypothetical protein
MEKEADSADVIFTPRVLPPLGYHRESRHSVNLHFSIFSFQFSIPSLSGNAEHETALRIENCELKIENWQNSVRGFVQPAARPLTLTLSPEYRGEGTRAHAKP